jgi:hypothetical protein
MTDALWTSDFTLAGRTVTVKKTGARVVVDRATLSAFAHWFAFYLPVRAKAAVMSCVRPGPRVWFAPDAPRPWYLIWALAPAAATDRPRLQALLGWGCVVLAMLVPPTGGDFLHRGYELTNAIAAAALLLLAWAGIDRFR